MVRVTPTVAATPQEIRGLYVLVDSSASRALGWSTQVRRLADLAAGLRDGAGSGTPLGVAAFDQEVAPVYEGTAGGFGAAEVRRLGARRPLGASDLQGALTWLGDHLAKDRGRFPRVLLLTDGVATAGDTETKALKAAVAALDAAGVERLDVLAVGGLRDDAVLRELVTGNLKQDGRNLDGAAPLPEIARRLTLASRSGLRVAVEGAAWVWPSKLDGVQPGDQVLVYADCAINPNPTAEQLAEIAKLDFSPLNVLIQVNIDDEASKHGCRPDEVAGAAVFLASADSDFVRLLNP